MDWNEKYQGKDYFYGTEPNDFLSSIASTWTTPKKILCIAEGEGRNAVFLARLGHQVSAIDSSSVARDKALALAEANNLHIDYQLADLNEFDFGIEQWDVIVSIFCHLPATLRQKVHQGVEAGLVTDGLFIMEAYNPKQLDFATGGPKDINLLYNLDTIKQDFTKLDWQQCQSIERFIHEGQGHNGKSAVIQIVAQKLA
jgi:SAM-dependent methyltransferase